MDWVIFGGVAAAMAGAMVKGGFELYKWHKNRVEYNHFSSQFKKRAEIYEAINGILQDTSAKRVLVMKTENGGGRPRTGKHIYASVLYEDFNPPFRSIINKRQRVRVGKSYLEILQHIASAEDQRKVMIAEDMPPSQIKSLYEQEGATFSQSHYLHEDAQAFYYVSIATDEEGMGSLASDTQQVMIEMYVDRLREIFNRK